MILSLKTIFRPLGLLSLCLSFCYPILPNAFNSINLGVLAVSLVITGFETFLINVKKVHLWRSYFFLSSYLWLAVFTFFWTEDKNFFFVELRPTLSLILLPFVGLFFTTKLITDKIDLYFKIYLAGLVLYLFFWFDHNIEGYGTFQEIILKRSSIKDESLIDQVFFLFNQNYINTIGSSTHYGHNILGGTSFFSHKVYISSYYVFGVFLAMYLFLKSNNFKHKFYYTLLILVFGGFIFYLSSIQNIALLILSFPIFSLFYFSNKKKILIIGSLLTILIIGFKGKDIYMKVKSLDWIQKVDNNMDYGVVIDYKRAKTYECISEKINKPFYGMGLGDIQPYMNKCLKEKNKNNPNFNAELKINSHSQYLHFYLVGGVLNFVLFCLMFFYLFITSIKQNHGILFFLTLIVFCLCLFENYLSRIYGVIFFVLFLIILINGGIEKKG